MGNKERRMKNKSWSCLLNKPQKDNHNFHSSFFFIFSSFMKEPQSLQISATTA